MQLELFFIAVSFFFPSLKHKQNLTVSRLLSSQQRSSTKCSCQFHISQFNVHLCHRYTRSCHCTTLSSEGDDACLQHIKTYSSAYEADHLTIPLVLLHAKFSSKSFDESVLMNRSASGSVPPVQLSTTGVNVLFSICKILALHSFFFICSWCLYIDIPFGQLLRANGFMTLMSKNARLSGIQKLRALTSALAPSVTFDPGGRTSPVTGRRDGSRPTSLCCTLL